MKYSLLFFIFIQIQASYAQVPLSKNPMYHKNDLELSLDQIRIAQCRDLFCALASSESMLGDDLVFRCSENYELVLKKVFKKNFNDYCWVWSYSGRLALCV